MRKLFSNKKNTKEVNVTVRKLFLIVALAAMAMMVSAGAAFAFGGHPGQTSSATPVSSANQYWDATPNTTYEEAESGTLTPVKAAGSEACEVCHGGGGHGGYAGPHGGYTTTTGKCATCHVVHSKVGNNNRVGESQAMLPGKTVTGVCNYCHDLTGADRAPYYTNYMTSTNDVQSAHYVEGAEIGKGLQANVNGAVYTDGFRLANGVIPGGDATNGGTLAYAGLFQEGNWSKNAANQFTCDSCHTPHAIKGSTVNAYFGESNRKGRPVDAGKDGVLIAGSRLLKQKLLAAQVDPITEYGSAWCAGCHQGRLTMAGPNYNHPVNKEGLGYNFGKVLAYGTFNGTTAAPVFATAYFADRGITTPAQIESTINGGIVTPAVRGVTDGDIKVLGYGDPTHVQGGGYASYGKVIEDWVAKDPRYNTWYTMTAGDPLNNNAPRPDGYLNISNFTVRDGSGNNDPNLNGPACQQCHASARDVEQAFTNSAAAPMTMTFPHISPKPYLLIEDDSDDLCTNCHGLDNLP